MDLVRSVVLETIEAYIRLIEKSRNETYIQKLKHILEQAKSDLDCTLTRELKAKIGDIVEDNLNSIDGLTMGKLYEIINTSSMKKEMGQVYTPETIVDYMIEDSVDRDILSEKGVVKALDPSCGSGFFLVKLYRKLSSIINDIDGRSDEEYQIGRKEEVAERIVKKMIYGAELDAFSVAIAKIGLMIESGVDCIPNISHQDILLEDYPYCFDLIIGNPPYIGTKSLKKEYRELLKERYSDVYEDKSDISYCFFERGYELLSKNGKLVIITSRYFIEALYAKKLRHYIKENYGIEKIVDFYGENVFKGMSISPLIIYLSKGSCNESLDYMRPKKDDFKLKQMELESFEKLKIGIENLSEEHWLMKDAESIALFEKIDSLGDYRLSEIAVSSQGLITGLDRAFILEDIEDIPPMERGILKRWAKNSDIKKYGRVVPDKYIVVTDEIEDVREYPYTMKQMESFKKDLQNRRECKLGIRKWYEIQWGRDKSNFEGERILFPYKASVNSFTMVTERLYHSADIYSIKVREGQENSISTEYLLAFLNSTIFEYYFKMVAKKLNKNIYEYYPNKIMNLRIKMPKKSERKRISEMVNMAMKSEADRRKITEEIDNIFLKLYDIEDREKEIILREI